MRGLRDLHQAWHGNSHNEVDEVIILGIQDHVVKCQGYMKSNTKSLCAWYLNTVGISWILNKLNIVTPYEEYMNYNYDTVSWVQNLGHMGSYTKLNRKDLMAHGQWQWHMDSGIPSNASWKMLEPDFTAISFLVMLC